MQPHNWKNLLFSIWLASNITKGCGIAVNTALAVNLDMENGICNGSTGVILRFENEKFPVVKF